MNIEKIKNILAVWNPLDVPVELAKDEYSSYIPTLIMKNKNEIYEWMLNFVMDSFSFKKISPQLKNETKKTADALFSAIQD